MPWDPKTNWGYSEETATTEITTSYTLLTLNGDTDGAVAPPRKIWLWKVDVDVSGQGTASSLTAKITEDSAGDLARAPEKTVNLVDGETTATDGSVTITFELPLITDESAIYLWVKSDADTPDNVTARAYWSRAV